MSRSNLLIYSAIIGSIFLAFWLRLENLDHYPPGISNDEAVNVIDAFHIARTGNFPMYEDQGRPEPLYRLFLTVGTALFGNSVWAARFVSVLFGTLTIAAAYRAAYESLRDVEPHNRRIAALTATAILTVMLGHITVTRSTYRAVPQPLFTFLFVILLLRGLRTQSWRDFGLAGLFLALNMYTYTAAIPLVAAVGAVALQLLIFSQRSLKVWLPRLLFTTVIILILMLPVAVLLLNRPGAVIGRAATVSDAGSGTFIDQLMPKLQTFIGQFFTLGDENPQYNVANAPLLPPGFAWLFVFGIVGLFTRIRQPSTAIIAALLVLSSIPVILTDEITHGLRVIGEFNAIALIAAVGVASLQVLAARLIQWRYVALAALAGLTLLTIGNAIYARQTYADYWEHADRWNLWPIHNMQLEHGEWFFRPDRRDFANWLIEQNRPLLIPVDELARPTTHTWLLQAYPNVTTADIDFVLPDDTLLVIPWSLETGDLMRNTRLFALLDNNTITLLRPLTTETHDALLSGIDDAEAITRASGQIHLLARIQPVDSAVQLETQTVSRSPIATFGSDELALTGWYGTDTITGEIGETLTYTLNWQPLRLMGHEYSSYLQLQTQNYESIAGDDVLMWRWLYPTSVWQIGDNVPDVHTLQIEQSLQPGAYRLVTGVYVYTDSPLPAIGTFGDTLTNAATIGWVKVPQSEIPHPPDSAMSVNATLDNTFSLEAFEVTRLPNGQIHVRLYWESLAQRPDIDTTVFVHFLDQGGDIVGQSDIRPWGGQYPTFIWDDGEIVATDHIIDIGDHEPDSLTIYSGMYTYPDITNLPVIQNGEVAAERRITLGNVGDLLGDG